MRACVVLLLLCACPVPPEVIGEGEGEGEGEGGEGEGENPQSCSFDDDTGFPAPLDNRVSSVGSSSTLDVAAWNLSHFGNEDEHDQPRQVELIADVITSLDVDIVGVEEVEDERSFNELLQRLPGHDGVLGSSAGNEGGFDQRVGFLYRCGALSMGDVTELFRGNFNFPRAPLQVEMHYDDGENAFDFVVIVVHFKAFTDTESVIRRQEAFVLLENYVSSLVDSDSAPDEVMVLGDFNERLDDSAGQEAWTPFLDDEKYVVRTQVLSDRGEGSFIGSGFPLLDHIVTTRAFDDEVGAGVIKVPHLDDEIPNYRDDVSDHRPVTLVLKGL